MANCYALRPTRAETEKTAQSGTLMMRRSEVLGVVRKMLHYAYRNAETAGLEGRVHDVEIQQARMRTLIALREALKAIPVFENPAAASATEARRAETEDTGSVHESAVAKPDAQGTSDTDKRGG